MCLRTLILLLALLALPFGSVQALNWNEGILGDLSGDGNAPSFILFTEGSNLIDGTMGSLNGVGPLDADIWSFTIAAGYYLTGINLVAYSAPSAGIDSFMAMDDVGTINTTDPSQHLSNGLWTEELDGFGDTYTNMLAILDAGPAFGGTGFNGPLGPGTYTFWIQEGSDQVSYTIDFVVTAVPVPEPGSVLLLGAAGLVLLRRRRCRRR